MVKNNWNRIVLLKLYPHTPEMTTALAFRECGSLWPKRVGSSLWHVPVRFVVISVNPGLSGNMRSSFGKVCLRPNSWDCPGYYFQRMGCLKNVSMERMPIDDMSSSE